MMGCILLLMLSAQLLIQAAADSPIAPGSKPKNEGAIGAGEGPAWHPEEGLYFTGGKRITPPDRSGNVAVFREPAGGGNGLIFVAQKQLGVWETRNRRITPPQPGGAITALAQG